MISQYAGRKIESNMNKFAIILILLLCATTAFPESSAGMGTMSGIIMEKEGKPAAAGFIMIYKKNNMIPFNIKQYRFEPDEVAFVEKDGSFSVRLQPGSYFLDVVLRTSSYITGPPAAGEYYSIGRDERGGPREYIINSGKTVDIGSIGGFTPYEGLSSQTINTGITGKVQGPDGRPASEAVVFAYTDISMTGNAVYISDETGDDGKYVLGVYRGGTYYLVARDMSNDSMRKLGVYGGFEPAPVILKTDSVISGIDIGN